MPSLRRCNECVTAEAQSCGCVHTIGASPSRGCCRRQTTHAEHIVGLFLDLRSLSALPQKSIHPGRLNPLSLAHVRDDEHSYSGRGGKKRIDSALRADRLATRGTVGGGVGPAYDKKTKKDKMMLAPQKEARKEGRERRERETRAYSNSHLLF